MTFNESDFLKSLETDLIMAPMMDVTTPSFVKMCKSFGGVGLYSLPMVFINQIRAAPKTIKYIAKFAEKERPSTLQICGSGKSIEDVEGAVDILNSYDFDILDINSGCPARHTCNSGGGVSLMKPHRFRDLSNLVNTTIKKSNKPVSVKIRKGWESEEGLKEIIKMIEDAGAIFITIHGRTAKDKYGNIVDLDSIKRVKNSVNIPVIGNGDVNNFETYDYMKHYTKVNAVMIGRASQQNPRVFSEINNAKNKGTITYPDRNIEDRNGNTIPEVFSKEYKSKTFKINSYDEIVENLTVLLKSINDLDSFWNNDRFKNIELKRNAIWMLKGVDNGTEAKRKLSRIREWDKLENYLFGDEFKLDLNILK